MKKGVLQMKRNFLIYGIFSAIMLNFFAGFNYPVNANFTDVLNTINRTSYTINSVNKAGRGTMSTIEYAQRFTDRQQDRQDRKRAEKDYNANAQDEYYRTLQETQRLRNQYYNNL